MKWRVELSPAAIADFACLKATDIESWRLAKGLAKSLRADARSAITRHHIGHSVEDDGVVLILEVDAAESWIGIRGVWVDPERELRVEPEGILGELPHPLDPEKD